MFGSYRKFGQTEIVFYVNRKIRAHERKIIYILIFPTNNFQKSHLKRESLSTLLTRSKTHIQAHLSQAPASPNCAVLWSKTHLQAYLQTISKKKKNEPRKESRAGKIAHTTTPDRTIVSNLRLHHHTQPQIAPFSSHPSIDEITPMLDLSLSRSTSLFPSIVNHSLFLPLSPFHRIFEFNECFVLIFVSFKFIIEIFYYEICCLEREKIFEKNVKN